MAITTQMRTDVANLYVALFGRAPERDGLGYWVNQLDAGKTVAQVAQEMYNTDPARATYPTFLTNEEIIGRFYTNVLGRTADADGLAYWTAKLNAGATKGAVIAEMITAVTAYTGTDAAAVDSKALFTNKVTVGLYYAVTQGGNDVTAATNILVGVTKDAATVEAAKTGASTAVGKTLTLTVNQDSGSAFVGGTANDTFNAAAAQDGAGTLINTLQNVDVIDGGDGTDTLNVTEATGATVAATIKNIENIAVRHAGAGTISLANATGVTSVTVADSTTAGTVSNLGTVANIAVKTQAQNASFGSSTATTLNVTLDTFGKSTATNTLDIGVTAAAKATTLNATLNNAYAVLDSTNDDAVTTLTIAATGTNTLSLVDSGNDVTSATVTGAGSVDLTGTALTGALTKFDGSASTGAIKVNIQSSKTAAISTGSGADVIDVDTTVQALTTVDAGAGNDSVYVGALLGSFKSVAGGEGTDTINITNGATWTSANSKLISGFETLDISGGQGTYDVSLVNFTTVQIDEAVNGALAAAATLSNVADTSTLNIMSKAKTNANFATGQDITVTLKDAAGTTALGTAESTTLNVTINDGNKDDAADGNVTVTKLTAAGVENVTVNSVVGTTDGGTTGVKDNGYSTTITAGVFDAVETLTLTGTTDIIFTALTNAGNTLTKVNAGGSSGDITLNASAITTQVAYTGSSGVDTYTATNGGSIYGGAGNDQVTLTAAGAGGKADTIILKAAGDVSFKDANADSKIDAAGGIETITNFITAAAAVANTEEADVLDVTTFAFAGYARSAVNKGALANSVEGGAFATTIADFFADAAGDRGVAFGTNGGATYVFIDADKDGNWNSANDVAVKLAGVADFAISSIAF